MYSGTSASYRYGRTIRGHYPYVVTRQLIWTARRRWRLSSFLICDMRVLPPKQASLGSTELSHDAVYGAGRSPLGTRRVSGKDEPSGSPEFAAMSYRLRSRAPAAGGISASPVSVRKLL
jgi:hypothetical protein